MKEATGEANITVITIVLIAIVLAVGTVIVNSVLKNTGKSSACTAAGAYWISGKCCTKKDTNGKCAGSILTCKKAKDNVATEGGLAAKNGEYYCVGKHGED